jgi:hypothetical protein
MAIIAKQVTQFTAPDDDTQATTTASPLFIVNQSIDFPGKAYAITSMFFCNRANEPAFLTIYLVPKNKNPSALNITLKQLSINTGDTFSFDTEKIILGEGDSIWASADRNNAINAFLSVVQVQ